MDVKSAFLNGYISEEVYVHQPPGFEDEKNPDHVFKLKKSLYGLKQAPKAWYERLSSFLLENEFVRGKVDTTLFCKTYKDDILIVQIYVDDINPCLAPSLDVIDFCHATRTEIDIDLYIFSSEDEEQDNTQINQ